MAALPVGEPPEQAGFDGTAPATLGIAATERPRAYELGLSRLVRPVNAGAIGGDFCIQ